MTSLLKYKQAPGYHYFAEVPDGRLVLQRVNFAPSLASTIAKQSALARYLFINLSITSLPKRIEQSLKRDPGPGQAPYYVANTLADVDPERISDSERAVRQFLADLPVRTGLSPKDVLFILDGIRPNLYDEEHLEIASTTYFGVMREYFTQEAKSRGFEVVDLQPRFIRHYQRYGDRFEFDRDHDWNSLGHQIAFDGVMSSRFAARFTGRGQTRDRGRREESDYDRTATR